MLNIKKIFLIIVACIFLPLKVNAQSNQVGFGAVFATPEQLKKVPVVLKYRGYLPQSADLSKRMLPPGTQGMQSSCVAWAVAYGAESYYANSSENSFNRSKFIGSPAFVFNQLTPDKNSCRSGTVVTDALALLRQQGVASMSDFPYREDSCSALPSAQVQENASRYRINGFSRIQSRDIEAIKAQVYSGHPVIFVMKVPQTFLDLRGQSIYKDLDSRPIDGHAMVIVGYDDNKSAFRVINSWGDWWADKGYAWIDYQTTMYRGEEFYVIDPGFSVKRADEFKPVETEINPAPVPVPAPIVTPHPVIPVPTPTIKPTPIVKPVEIPPKIVLSKDEIKQKIIDIGSTLQCSRIDPSVSESGDVFISGFVKDQADLNKLRTQSRAIYGVNSVSTKILINPWPICEANQTLDSYDVSNSGLRVEIPNHANGILKKGDVVGIQVKTSKLAGYLYLSYLQANGEAVELMWGQKVPANSIANFAGKIEVAEPFGQELLIAIVSSKPLFNSRDAVFTDRRFLSVMRETLSKLNPNEKKEIAVSLLPIKTVER